MTDEPVGFMARLKQHHIYRVVMVYAITAWILIQAGNAVFPDFGLPRSDVRAVIVVLLLLFPVVLVASWMLIKPKDPTKFSRWQKLRWKLGSVLSLVVLILVVISGGFVWRYSTHHPLKATAVQLTNVPVSATSVPAAVAIPAKSIAVLPFENLSPDKNNAYFADGMQDLILTKLAVIGDLKMISRTSPVQYASHPEDLKTIGQQLGVATVLEGSVQKSGNQVLINVQLVDTQTDNHIWAQSYQRTLDNVFGVEGEVAEKIAAALDAKLTHAETARLAAVPTQNPAALDLFLRAEYQMSEAELGGGNPLRLAAAIPLYRQAITTDPGFALAYARLSYAESDFTYEGAGGKDAAQLNSQARADAEQAFKLAPDLAAAQLALGYNDYWGRRDFYSALKAFAATLSLRPNDPDALEGQGLAQRRLGRFDAAIASLEQAFTQNPRNSVLAADIGSTYMMMGRYPDAERWSQRALTVKHT